MKHTITFLLLFILCGAFYALVLYGAFRGIAAH